MKLLFDQNLSPKLVKLLAVHFPDGAHVRDFNLRHASDGTIWSEAIAQGRAIVTQDNDFHQRSLLELMLITPSTVFTLVHPRMRSTP